MEKIYKSIGRYQITAYLLIMGLLILPSTGIAETEELSEIGGAYEFLGPGIRPLGMGGAFVAVADDLNAIRSNPAGLSLQKRRNIEMVYLKPFNLDGIHYSTFEFLLPMSVTSGAMGLGLQFQMNRDMYGTDIYGNNTGELSQYYVKFSAGYGQSISRWLSIGGNVNLYHSSPEIKSNGAGFNAGVLITPIPNLSLAVAGINLVAPIKAYDNWEHQPRNITAGASYRITAISFLEQMTLACDVEHLSSSLRRLLIGVEGRYSATQWNTALVFRAGWQQPLDSKEESNFTFGFGIMNKQPRAQFQLDYAFVNHSVLQSTNLMTALNVHFGPYMDVIRKQRKAYKYFHNSAQMAGSGKSKDAMESWTRGVEELEAAAMLETPAAEHAKVMNVAQRVAKFHNSGVDAYDNGNLSEAWYKLSSGSKLNPKLEDYSHPLIDSIKERAEEEMKVVLDGGFADFRLSVEVEIQEEGLEISGSVKESLKRELGKRFFVRTDGELKIKGYANSKRGELQLSLDAEDSTGASETIQGSGSAQNSDALVQDLVRRVVEQYPLYVGTVSEITSENQIKIDMGTTHGLKKGSKCIVYSADQIKAIIQILDVPENSLSIAEISEQIDTTSIKIGYRVQTR